ncbi:MAG TPA: hypothetical protein VMZ50_12595, partial [Phycisphaerae bacterium]|nr:hypothetical protein [Phycisphaerae bacterium]
AYQDLTGLFYRIWRQEWLMCRLVSEDASSRRDACGEIMAQVRVARMQKVRAARSTAPASTHHHALDHRRFLPHFEKVLVAPQDRAEAEIIAGAMLAGHLRAESQRAQLEALTRYVPPKAGEGERPIDRGAIRRAAVEALAELGGEESWKAVAALADDPDYELDVSRELVKLGGAKALPALRTILLNKRGDLAARQMIRLGDDAAPFVVSVLAKSTDFNSGAGYFLVRAYYDYWMAIPKPLDPRIAAAVRDYVARSQGGGSDYAAKLLKVITAAKRPSDAREAFEWFVEALVTGAEEADKRIRPSMQPRHREPLERLRKMGTKDRPTVLKVYASRDYAWAIVTAKTEHFLLTMETRRGDSWRIDGARHVPPDADGRRDYDLVNSSRDTYPDTVELPPRKQGPPREEPEAAPPRPAPADSGKDLKGKAAVEDVARRFLAAIADRNGEAMRGLILEDPPRWTKDRMPRLAKELRDDVYAEDPARLTNIRETVLKGDLAAVRADGPKRQPGKHLVLILQRGVTGWRVRAADDSGAQVPSPPLREQLERYIRRLTGEEGPLRGGKIEPGQVERLWDHLAAEDPDKARDAMVALIAAGDGGLEAMSGRLNAAVASVEPPKIRRLIKELDDNEAATRERASEELAGLGRLAEPALRDALAKTASPEARSRIEALLDAC